MSPLCAAAVTPVAFMQIFINEAREKGHIQDDIVDEHAMLLYINYTADRCKRDRRGELIPGTRVGAVSQYGECVHFLLTASAVANQEGVLRCTAYPQGSRCT